MDVRDASGQRSLKLRWLRPDYSLSSGLCHGRVDTINPLDLHSKSASAQNHHAYKPIHLQFAKGLEGKIVHPCPTIRNKEKTDCEQARGYVELVRLTGTWFFAFAVK
ncbi:hypothetical protein WN944_004204 [Citrus x changshan-huyou]|uniref:Uncharacterized protein n=1 Tax=Citrus x changshan-huyou TaxID=2935761 RepID=A0AAP0M2S6_9ROSI